MKTGLEHGQGGSCDFTDCLEPHLRLAGQKTVALEPGESRLTNDARLLPVREFVGLTQQLSDVLEDLRDSILTQHSFTEMTRSRIFDILADYGVQNDHDALRSDPVFRLSTGGYPEGNDPARQSTLSRFENAVSVRCLRCKKVFPDPFIASFEEPTARLTFDIDTYDDPAHGQQRLVLFHG